MMGIILMAPVYCCVASQMTHCPDIAVKPRQLKIFWTSTGTSKVPAQTMEQQQEPLMMEQEVRE